MNAPGAASQRPQPQQQQPPPPPSMGEKMAQAARISRDLRWDAAVKSTEVEGGQIATALRNLADYVWAHRAAPSDGVDGESHNVRLLEQLGHQLAEVQSTLQQLQELVQVQLSTFSSQVDG